jgi:hypothetical protein
MLSVQRKREEERFQISHRLLLTKQHCQPGSPVQVLPEAIRDKDQLGKPFSRAVFAEQVFVQVQIAVWHKHYRRLGKRVRCVLQKGKI